MERTTKVIQLTEDQFSKVTAEVIDDLTKDGKAPAAIVLVGALFGAKIAERLFKEPEPEKVDAEALLAQRLNNDTVD